MRWMAIVAVGTIALGGCNEAPVATAGGAMYVYYTPTHFRPLTEAEKDRERQGIKRAADAHAKAAERIV